VISVLSDTKNPKCTQLVNWEHSGQVLSTATYCGEPQYTRSQQRSSVFVWSKMGSDANHSSNFDPTSYNGQLFTNKNRIVEYFRTHLLAVQLHMNRTLKLICQSHGSHHWYQGLIIDVLSSSPSGRRVGAITDSDIGLSRREAAVVPHSPSFPSRPGSCLSYY